ncbi:hypothetical protein HDU67_003663 [Dinochytrium kinnereticum]|nr:hypothetical protein HDU67_003663 [Dinochytrium kinnereticum]
MSQPLVSLRRMMRAGQAFVQELSFQGRRNNVTIRNVITFSPGQRSYTKELQTLIDAKAQTVIISAAVPDGARVITSARNLTMLNGDYWLIITTGFDALSFTAPDEKLTRTEMQGLWQVYPREPLLAGEFQEFTNWWQENILLNGTITVNSTGASCDLSIPFARGCLGKGPGVVGVMQDYARLMGGNEGLRLTQWWMGSGLACVKMLAETADFYMKSGNVTFADINARRLLTNAAAGNISNLFNRVGTKDLWNGVYKLDGNGDAILDMGVFNYKFNPEINNTIGMEIGVWNHATDQVTITGEKVFLGGRTQPPQPPPTPTIQFKANMQLRYAFNGIVAICSFMSLALGGAMVFFIKQKIFKASSPIFLTMYYPITASSCITYAWLKYLGFAVVFGSLIVKTYRIFVIFTSKRKAKQKLSDGIMMAYFLVLLSIWVVLLIIWTLVPTQRPYLEFDRRFNIDEFGLVASVEETPHCEFGGFNYVCLAAMVLTLALGVFLTYSVRATPGAFNESQWMAYAIYNWVVIGIVLNAIANFAVTNPDIIFVMEALTVIITQTGVCIFMIAPKLWVIKQGGGDEIDTFNSDGSASSTSKNQSSASRVTASVMEAKEMDALRKKMFECEREMESLRKVVESQKKEIETLRVKGTE